MMSKSAASLPESPPRIRLLPPQLINQIAAGEVVTRPAAAIKELVENSLDAGARRIEIHVDEDALSFLIRDDGRGMDEENLRLSVERHATSKIATIEDLERISTRGFRGEALAAISAVARLEILSRPAGAEAEPDAGLEGRRLRASGGGALRIEACGAPAGTTVQVRDLFFNTPARLKFLKNPVAEWGHILQALIRQALARPDVAFSIRWKGKPYLDLPEGQTLIERLAETLPGGAGKGLLAVRGVLNEVSIAGAVTHPDQTRRDRRYQHYFINGRPVVHRPLQFALEEAYRGLLMTQRYPMAAIMIELPGEMVDVNVHPTKEEVRLRNESLVAGAVHRAVAETLRAADLVPTLHVAAPHLRRASDEPLRKESSPAPGESSPAAPADPSGRSLYPMGQISPAASPPPGTSPGASGAQPLMQAPAFAQAPEHRGRQLDFVTGFGLPGGAARASQAASDAEGSQAAQGAYAEPAAREEATLIGRLRRAPEPPRAIAQIGLTYILAEMVDEQGEGLLVIDQHAAHEKIMYLQWMKQASASRIEVQPLLIPHTIELSPAEAPALEALLPALASAGFEVEPFGGRSFLVQAIPSALERLDVPAFLRDLIDEIGAGDVTREMERLRHKIGARAACRAAVKSGDRLSREEMQRLVDDLLETEDSLRCPHGRPTAMRLTREQLDLQFGRLG